MLILEEGIDEAYTRNPTRVGTRQEMGNSCLSWIPWRDVRGDLLAGCLGHGSLSWNFHNEIGVEKVSGEGRRCHFLLGL